MNFLFLNITLLFIIVNSFILKNYYKNIFSNNVVLHKNKKNSINYENRIINQKTKDPVYTIIWKKNIECDVLLQDLEKNNMNVLFIDEISFSENNATFTYSKEPLVMENDDYLGGFFEVYEKIFEKIFKRTIN